jgi:hypothetical protein
MMSLYLELAQDSESGLESWSSCRGRVKWLKIYQLKAFLKENQLVSSRREDLGNLGHNGISNTWPSDKKC